MADYIYPSRSVPLENQYAPDWDDASTTTESTNYASRLPVSPPTLYHTPKPRYPAQALPYVQEYADGYYLQSSATLPMMAPHGAPSKIDKPYTAPRHELYTVPRPLIQDYDYYSQPDNRYTAHSSWDGAIHPPPSHSTEIAQHIWQMSHSSPAVDFHRISSGLPIQEPSSPPHSLSHHGVATSTSSYNAPRHKLHHVPRHFIDKYQDDYNPQPRTPYIDSPPHRAIRPPPSPFSSPPQSAVNLYRVSPGLQEPSSPPHSLSHHGAESSSSTSVSDKPPHLACFFCRSRKIACGRPPDGGPCKYVETFNLVCWTSLLLLIFIALALLVPKVTGLTDGALPEERAYKVDRNNQLERTPTAAVTTLGLFSHHVLMAGEGMQWELSLALGRVSGIAFNNSDTTLLTVGDDDDGSFTWSRLL
ncbi:hypothetical protein BDZ89DRAFT_1054701 [Hymenopellis radicata]|nr:hypothetical protein BDZ89DRAFT_1054701 [Hymenopellis radicata]